ncbi:hypothetical protein RB9739 [Rhodopirellula baltica SH 1]|uniref:Uncharacterized protein n=1 Tax=Rhodopirellula baltica (strain DSM 10527 / NCIMB 13988 / SH1) TaxID=243090 RepID=Q7UL49_RHOBA|nr:hypothetical protein RB9739 [Rhodopirellula baltica SH 1]
MSFGMRLNQQPASHSKNIQPSNHPEHPSSTHTRNAARTKQQHHAAPATHAAGACQRSAQ